MRAQIWELAVEAYLASRVPLHEPNHRRFRSQRCKRAVYKLVALYQRPPNQAAFDRHYKQVHLPMLRKIPGLIKLVVTPGLPPPWGGDPPYYLLTELHFRNHTAFDLATASPQYRTAHSDMQKFAREIVTLITLWGD